MVPEPHSSLANYLIRLQSEGRISFSRRQALSELKISESAFSKAATRLQKQKRLLGPRPGFYIVVPPQYHNWEAPPPSWYIDDLMRHENRTYYVGLLKAAELHGASHHAVMEFQIITDKQLPKIRLGRSILAFYFRKDMKPVSAGIERRKTDTGSMNISSPELTALDLIRYIHVVGGIDAAATVLADIGSGIDGLKLAALAPSFERSTSQRLGYLLESLGHSSAAEPLHASLFPKDVRAPWVALEPRPRTKPDSAPEPVETNQRWRVNVYRHPEIDK
jgi:hypothetical protein